MENLFQELNIQTLLDAPCGDFGWLRHVPLPSQYIGMDIMKDFIEAHAAAFADNPSYTFIHGDLTKDPLPKADLVLCRDCLVHFSNADILKALKNFKQSGSTYLLTTTFPECSENLDIVTGDWRTLNLENAPFNLPKPEQCLTEGCGQNEGLYADKSLGLWNLQTLDL